jgi:acyl-homoserine-lactone acylase
VPPAQPAERPHRLRRRALLGALVALAVIAGACAQQATPDPDPDPETGIEVGTPTYSATIRWSAYGIAHIEALDVASLGFGQGWAITGDRGCELFDQITKVRGERARWHGIGPGYAHLVSDLAYRSLELPGRADALFGTLGDEGRALLEGYAAGVNAWVDQVGAATLPDWCAEGGWVRPITAIDLLALHHDLAMVMSGRTLVGAIGTAAPPADEPVTDEPATDELPVAVPGRPALGGTAWAVGRRATGDATSLLALSAEFPLDGELALWENHLTIPDVLDVYGFSLVGLPGVFAGFNDALAFTQLPAPGLRGTFAAYELVPGSPTTYRRGDRTEAMEERVVTVEVLGPNGSVVPVERTMYATDAGLVVALPGMGWTERRAYAFTDATLLRPVLVDQLWGMNRARSLAELEASQAEVAATGWATTVAVAANGWALYADAAATPALRADTLVRALERIAADPVASAIAAAGGVLLDGGDPGDDWEQRDGAVVPGVVPVGELPRLQVRDWVVAAGAGEWAAASGTVAAPLPPSAQATATTIDGVTPTTRVPRELFPAGEPTSPQARNVVSIMRRLTAVSDRAEPLTTGRLRVELFSNQGLLGTQLADEVVSRCRASGPVTVPARVAPDGTVVWDAQEVTLAPTCDLLERWEGRWNLEDQAPAVWTQFLAAFDDRDRRAPGRLWSSLADPAEPELYPAVLAPAPRNGPDPIAVALAEATLAVGAAGFDIDDFWREAQYTERDGERVPLHGGVNGWDGAVLVTRSDTLSTSLAPLGDPGALLDPRSGLRRGGWPVRSGTGALLIVEFGPDGVSADGLLAYGQSADPDSPFFVDQAYRYSDRAWRPVLFGPDDLAAGVDRELVVRAERAP